MAQTVRVYADGRLCIPASVLNQFRNVSKQGKKTVWVSHFDHLDHTQVMLTWGKPDGSGVRTTGEYDLSVRDRVLFKAPGALPKFKPGQTFTFSVRAVGVFVSIAVHKRGKSPYQILPATKVKKPAKPKRPVAHEARNRANFKAVKTAGLLQARFEDRFRANLCKILKDPKFGGITLEQLAKLRPELTIGEIVSA